MPFLDRSDAGRKLAKALSAYRRQRPVALALPRGGPVAPGDTIRALQSKADTLISLETPGSFGGVGDFYDDFRQVSDEEVIAILGRFTATKGNLVS